MSSNNTSDVKSVVLIGFQFAGANFYRQLHKYLPASTAVKITIVNDRPYLFHNIASLRAVCDPSGRWIDLSFVPIDPQSALLGRKETELLIDSLVKVNKDSVELKSGKTLPFNYLILATGSSYRSPAKIQQPTIDDAKREMSSLSDKVQQSQSILVIGGGPVGVELAAELKSAYPEKQIALVHNTDQILPAHGLNEKAVRKTRSVLDSLGVKVVLGERIQISDWATFDPLTAKTLLTDKGNELKSDMQFICTGARPNTAYMSGEFHSSLDERQLIKVDRSLRVEGTQNIYAIGDINNLPCTKTVIHAKPQADFLGKHLALLLAKGKPLPEYKFSTSPLLALSMGPKHGVVQIGSIVLGNFMTSLMKSKNLFYQGSWDLMNKTVPK